MVESLGTINYAAEEGFQKSFSERTGAMIDEEVLGIINEQYQKCHDLLTERKEDIERLAEILLEKETISLPDIVDTLGPRPFPAKKQLTDYLEELRERSKEDEEAAVKADELPDEEAESEEKEADEEVEVKEDSKAEKLDKKE